MKLPSRIIDIELISLRNFVELIEVRTTEAYTIIYAPDVPNQPIFSRHPEDMPNTQGFVRRYVKMEKTRQAWIGFLAKETRKFLTKDVKSELSLTEGIHEANTEMLYDMRQPKHAVRVRPRMWALIELDKLKSYISPDLSRGALINLGKGSYPVFKVVRR